MIREFKYTHSHIKTVEIRFCCRTSFSAFILCDKYGEILYLLYGDFICTFSVNKASYLSIYNQDCMIFADFPVNSQQTFMKFCTKHYFAQNSPKRFEKIYRVFQKLDYLEYSKVKLRHPSNKFVTNGPPFAIEIANCYGNRFGIDGEIGKNYAILVEKVVCDFVNSYQ